jgi:hypothetical protein
MQRGDFYSFDHNAMRLSKYERVDAQQAEINKQGSVAGIKIFIWMRLIKFSLLEARENSLNVKEPPAQF